MKDRIAKEVDWRVRVFESLSFPTLILNPDRTILSANQIFLKKVGLTLDQVVNKTCPEIFSRYFYDQNLPCHDEHCPLSHMLKDKKGHSILRKIQEKNGEERWEDRIFSPILGEDGEVKYIMESVRDVTQVKTLEKMYSGIRELMDKVVHSSASAILAVDRSGKIILMNQAAEDLLGYTLEEANTIRARDIFPRGFVEKIAKKLRDESFGGMGKLPITEATVITKTGESVPVEMTAAIIYEGVREVGAMGIFNDLREKMLVEKQLREVRAQVVQSEKMASLGRLAAGVAHEINNPLTSILLHGNMMLEKLEDDHPLEQHLNFVLEDAGRCRDIVKNLLAHSRYTKASKERFQLNLLVDEGLKLIRDQKLFVDVQIVKEMAEESIPILADRNQLYQVFINLVMNAMDAMDYSGILKFRTYTDKSAGYGCLEIQDTGCGIPKEQITKVFDPFFTTKEPGKGTGLGLSTVYGIIQENKGRISIKNTGPGGTTFLLELPLENAPDGAPCDLIG